MVLTRFTPRNDDNVTRERKKSKSGKKLLTVGRALSSFTNRTDENSETASMKNLHENEKKVVDTVLRCEVNSRSAEANAKVMVH